MYKFKNPSVKRTYQSYPEDMRVKLMVLRELIIDVTAETPDIGDVEETLKWGEPSYLVRGGSTVRIAWKESKPEYYAMYFNCNTRLVDTFKELYSDLFNFEGKRAIVFHREDQVSSEELKHCVALSFQYHKLKHLPLLGV